MDLETESDTDSQEYRTQNETRRLRHVFEPYFKKIFCYNGFIKHMNQRCTGNYDSTSYILLCEAIKRNDNRNAIALLKHYCKANMGKPDPSKDIPLQLAILAGNVEIVELLLSKGARVNISFQDHKEPLHLICDKDSTSIPNEISRIAIAKMLIKHGADINAVEKVNKDTPLILAVRSKFLELTKFLLNNGSNRYYGNKHSETALHAAFSENAGIEMIELLYDENFDLHQMDKDRLSVFSYAVRNLMNSGFGSFFSFNEPMKPIQFLLNHGVSVNSTLDKRGNKVLHMICQNHAVQTMKIFLEYGADVNVTNEDGKTPLHFCAENQSTNFVELLLEHGADAHALTVYGQSVLHFAAANKNHKVLQLLLKHQLDVNGKAKDGNFTPLFNAVWSNRCENVRLLLDWQANVNERIINSQIVLHVAVDQKHVEIVEILLEFGSDINVLDDYGNTPLTISLYQLTDAINSGWSDEEDEDEDVMRPAELVKKILTRHTAKIFLSGKYVSDQSMRVMNNYHFKYFFECCLAELCPMKGTQIIEGVTYFDILTKSKKELVSFMRNADFTESFNAINYKEKFPIYAKDLEYNVQVASKRLFLLKVSTENLAKIVRNTDESWADFHLPCLIAEHILDYLHLTDLQNLSLVYT